MRFLAALQFLTIIPWKWSVDPGEAGRSTGYFPVIGAIIGAILVGLHYLLGWLLPPPVVNVLLVVAMVIVTGALHLDGLVDTCDGLGSAKTPEDRWQVMHDSRAGGFGVIGAGCLLLTKYVVLNSVPPGLMMATLVLMPVVSRWTMVYAIAAYPYARPSGLGKLFKQGTDRWQLVLATVVALAVAVALFKLWGLVIMFGVWVIIALVAGYLKRRFAGLTGDTYGAINEVAEVGVLLIISLLAYKDWL
ncbi:adenosylcobinamide-GDP ribazoletransferase [Chloroflexota bacterium]